MRAGKEEGFWVGDMRGDFATLGCCALHALVSTGGASAPPSSHPGPCEDQMRPEHTEPGRPCPSLFHAPHWKNETCLSPGCHPAAFQTLVAYVPCLYSGQEGANKPPKGYGVRSRVKRNGFRGTEYTRGPPDLLLKNFQAGTNSGEAQR